MRFNPPQPVPDKISEQYYMSSRIALFVVVTDSTVLGGDLTLGVDSYQDNADDNDESDDDDTDTVDMRYPTTCLYVTNVLPKLDVVRSQLRGSLKNL